MPRISEMAPSKFIKSEELPEDGILVTITACRQHNVAVAGAEEELKYCLEFKEVEKPLVLNITNMRIIEKIFGTDEADEWVGKQIVLYNDPTIMYKGEVKGGTRVRKSNRPQPVPAQTTPAIPPGGYKIPQQHIPTDEIPF